MNSERDPLEDTASHVLKRHAPAWYWARKNFSATSLLTIAGVVASSGGYIIHLQTRVTVVENEVYDLKSVVPDSKAVADIAARVSGQGERISRLEKNWDDAAEAAARSARQPAAPPRRRHPTAIP